LTTTEEDLRLLFGTFGKITECKVMVDKNTGISHQIGFVRFETTDQAKEAIQAMNNYKLTPTSPPLVVKYADTKEQKDARKIFRQKNPVEEEQPGYSSSPVYYYSPSQYAFVYPPSYYEMPEAAYIGSPGGEALYGSPYTQQYFPPQPYFFEAPHMYPAPYGSPYGSPGHPYSAPYAEPPPEEYSGMFFPGEYEAQNIIPEKKKSDEPKRKKDKTKITRPGEGSTSQGDTVAKVGSPTVHSAPIEMRIKKLSLDDQ